LAFKDRAIAEAFQRAQAAERETATVKLDQVGTIIDSLTKDKDAARRDYRLAMEAGDFDKASEAQERMAISAARIVAAERGKLELTEEVKNPPRQQAPIASDPVEAVARSMGTQRSADWIRAHPDMVESGAISPLALAGHNLAVYNGHSPDSDGYFSYIEQFVKNSVRQPATDRQTERRDGGGRDMRSLNVSAPVGREATQSPGASRPGTVRLEPHEVQTAIDTYAPLYPKDNRDQLLRRYATDKAALMAEGKIGQRS
jgi:hypothetical protein